MPSLEPENVTVPNRVRPILRLRREGIDASRPASARGQSLVEFALVLPMLLVLLLGIADFGRVFQAGIILEATARNGAEAAAQELVQLRRNKPTGLTPSDYTQLHNVAVETACEEAAKLDETAPCALDGVAVCVHDDQPGEPAGHCGIEAPNAPANCTQMADLWDPAIEGGAAPPLPYVEVRACYQFTTLIPLSDLDLPFGWSLALGDVWLQRDRSFVAGHY